MGLAPESRLWIGPVTIPLLPVIAASLLASVPAAVAAQTAPGVLPPTREEVTRPETQVRRDEALRLEVEGGLERAPCALDSPEFKDIRFTLRGAEFDGLREVRPEGLADSYAALVGTEQPISVVCEIRDRAADILRDAGYIAAVEVPEQRIALQRPVRAVRGGARPGKARSGRGLSRWGSGRRSGSWSLAHGAA